MALSEGRLRPESKGRFLSGPSECPSLRRGGPPPGNSCGIASPSRGQEGDFRNGGVCLTLRTQTSASPLRNGEGGFRKRPRRGSTLPPTPSPKLGEGGRKRRDPW